MKNRNRKFILILLGTILLPIISYIINEVLSLKENERIIIEIYDDQLNTIIFSVNQYSDDLINQLVDKIENEFPEETINQDVRNLLEISGAIAYIIMSSDEKFQFQSIQSVNDQDKNNLIARIAKDSLIISRLRSYKQTGYRKIEPVSKIEINDQMGQLFYAVLGTSPNVTLLACVIDPRPFIFELLKPKLQQIGNEKLIITISEGNSLIYATDTLQNEISASAPMWLFPGIEVGLSPKGGSVSELVAQRIQYNLIASALLISMIAFGIFLIIRNLNREMKLAQTKADFVSNVSHELRTPLSLISMFAETLMLGRVKLQEKKQEYFEIIFKETNRLTNIVNRILNFSQIEADKRKYNFSEQSLNQLIQEVIHNYSFHLDQSSFDYKVDLPQENIQHSIDKEAIVEAVVNLLDNAIKYSDKEKYITVTLKQSSELIAISVSDKGMGIPPDKLTEVFDKFYRVSGRDIYTKSGTGLGLAIVKHIMEAHHGHVAVESKEGIGSTFSLNFKK